MHKCLKLFLVSLKLKFSDINCPFHYTTDLLFIHICNKNMELQEYKHEVNNVISCLLLLLLLLLLPPPPPPPLCDCRYKYVTS